jgi:hypothetical protein
VRAFMSNAQTTEQVTYDYRPMQRMTNEPALLGGVPGSPEQCLADNNTASVTEIERIPAIIIAATERALLRPFNSR